MSMKRIIGSLNEDVFVKIPSLQNVYEVNRKGFIRRVDSGKLIKLQENNKRICLF